MRKLLDTAAAVLTFVAVMALLTATARGASDPPPLVTPDPPALAKRVSDLEKRVAALEGKGAAPGAVSDRVTIDGIQYELRADGFYWPVGSAGYIRPDPAPIAGSAAPAVAAPPPFVPAALSTGAVTPVRSAGWTTTIPGYSAVPGQYGELTYTLTAGLPGITVAADGCANGNCPAPQRVFSGRRR